MSILAFLLVAAVVVFSVWYGRRLFRIIKADGYGFRSSSGLPRGWSPSDDWSPDDLPSTPYSVRPHF